jgi:NCS1 family nucleobase:cation symporter-1
MTDQPARIEHHTIYPIPAGERHGRARDLFTIWFGSNIMILTIVTGVAAASATARRIRASEGFT